MLGVEKKVAQGRPRGRRYSVKAISFSSTWGRGNVASPTVKYLFSREFSCWKKGIGRGGQEIEGLRRE